MGNYTNGIKTTDNKEQAISTLLEQMITMLKDVRKVEQEDLIQIRSNLESVLSKMESITNNQRGITTNLQKLEDDVKILGDKLDKKPNEEKTNKLFEDLFKRLSDLENLHKEEQGVKKGMYFMYKVLATVFGGLLVLLSTTTGIIHKLIDIFKGGGNG